MLQEMKCSYIADPYKWLLRLGRPTCVEEYMGHTGFSSCSMPCPQLAKQQPREACQKTQQEQN